MVVLVLVILGGSMGWSGGFEVGDGMENEGFCVVSVDAAPIHMS